MKIPDGKPKTLKQLLASHRRERDHLWEKLNIRLQHFKTVAEKDGSPFLIRFIEEVEEYRTFETLYRALLYRRSEKPEDTQAEKPRYTPYDRSSTDIQERLKSGLAQRIFQPN